MYYIQNGRVEQLRIKEIVKDGGYFLNIEELKNIGLAELIKHNIDDGSTKINLLLQYVLKMSKIDLLVNSKNEVTDLKRIEFLGFVQDIIEGKPIQYITNNQEFMGLDFYVDKNVLIPQPDTEILVENVIEKIKKMINMLESKQKIYVLDLCTGSGAIAVAIENYLEKNNIVKKVKIYASDISEEALKVAKKNDILNNEERNITFVLSNLFDNIERKFDIIVSNPPYIEEDIITKLSKEVQNEPYIALNGGKDGLDFYRKIAQEGRKYLQEDGYIFLEIGYNQREYVNKIFSEFEEYRNIECIKDLAGNDRVMKISFRENNKNID